MSTTQWHIHISGEISQGCTEEIRHARLQRSQNPYAHKWPSMQNGIDFDQKVYRSMIGSLLYLCASRPDIMLSVCMCARYQATPKESHHKAVKHILRYLAHIQHLDYGTPRARLLISLDILTLTMLVIVWTASQHLVHVISSDDLWSVGLQRNRTAYHCLLLKLSTLLLVLAALSFCG